MSGPRLTAWITINAMAGEIPAPSGERRNSIIPGVATGHQSPKRDETRRNTELDGVYLLAGSYGQRKQTSTITVVMVDGLTRVCGFSSESREPGPKRIRLGASVSLSDWCSPPLNPADRTDLQAAQNALTERGNHWPALADGRCGEQVPTESQPVAGLPEKRMPEVTLGIC